MMMSTHVQPCCPVPKQPNHPQAKYVLRIKTRKTLSDPLSGVNVCISDASGNFVMRRLQGEPRFFMRGSMDVFQFTAPMIEGPVSLLVSQESGKWGLDEVELLTNGVHIGRYIWTGSPALQLYKSPYAGMTKDEIRSMLNEEYMCMKDQIRSSVGQLAALGTASTWVALGPKQAAAFGLGSALAAMYAYLLEQEVDTIGTSRRAVGMVARMIVLSGSAAAAVKYWDAEIQADNGLFLLGLLGFMVFKASLVRLLK